MIEGKTIFSWNVPAFMNGDPAKFAQAIYEANFDGILIKVADGPYRFKMKTNGSWPNFGENLKAELFNKLRELGIKVYFWQFVYGNDPIGELAIADYYCATYKPDGYVWNAESAFDSKPNAPGNAIFLSAGLKNYHPEIPQGVAWWALPKDPKNLNREWHPVKVIEAFMKNVDVAMPMMYWQKSTPNDALSYLDMSSMIWDTISNFNIMPIGRAYNGDGGTVTNEAVSFFASKVMDRRERFKGISWWCLDSAVKFPLVWDALKKTKRYSDFVVDESKLSREEMLRRIVGAHQHLYPELYKPT